MGIDGRELLVNIGHDTRVFLFSGQTPWYAIVVSSVLLLACIVLVAGAVLLRYGAAQFAVGARAISSQPLVEVLAQLTRDAGTLCSYKVVAASVAIVSELALLFLPAQAWLKLAEIALIALSIWAARRLALSAKRIVYRLEVEPALRAETQDLLRQWETFPFAGAQLAGSRGTP